MPIKSGLDEQDDEATRRQSISDQTILGSSNRPYDGIEQRDESKTKLRRRSRRGKGRWRRREWRKRTRQSRGGEGSCAGKLQDLGSQASTAQCPAVSAASKRKKVWPKKDTKIFGRKMEKK